MLGDVRPRCRKHRNVAVCVCGGCALRDCCPHPEDPEAMRAMRTLNLEMARRPEYNPSYAERYSSAGKGSHRE